MRKYWQDEKMNPEKREEISEKIGTESSRSSFRESDIQFLKKILDPPLKTSDMKQLGITLNKGAETLTFLRKDTADKLAKPNNKGVGTHLVKKTNGYNFNRSGNSRNLW